MRYIITLLIRHNLVKEVIDYSIISKGCDYMTIIQGVHTRRQETWGHLKIFLITILNLGYKVKYSQPLPNQSIKETTKIIKNQIVNREFKNNKYILIGKNIF